MRNLVLLCLAAALPSSCLLAADEKPKKEESATAAVAAPLPLEATKASVRRKLIEQIVLLENRIIQAEKVANNQQNYYNNSDGFRAEMTTHRQVAKDILIASQAQLIQALAELAKICD